MDHRYHLFRVIEKLPAELVLQLNGQIEPGERLGSQQLRTLLKAVEAVPPRYSAVSKQRASRYRIALLKALHRHEDATGQNWSDVLSGRSTEPSHAPVAAAPVA